MAKDLSDRLSALKEELPTLNEAVNDAINYDRAQLIDIDLERIPDLIDNFKEQITQQSRSFILVNGPEELKNIPGILFQDEYRNAERCYLLINGTNFGPKDIVSAGSIVEKNPSINQSCSFISKY